MGDDSALEFWWLLSILSPKLPFLVSAQESLAHSAPPLPELWISGCKWKFLRWPFKWLFASPTASPWQTETPLFFTARCYLGSVWLWCCRLWSSLWDLDPALLRRTPPAAERPLRNSSCCPWEPSQPSRASALRASLAVGPLIVRLLSS